MTFFPEGLSKGLIAQAVRDSALLRSLHVPDPYARRGHYLRFPKWLRWLPIRRPWVWDESKKQHAARVAKLPPRPKTIRFPVIGSGA